MTTNNQCNHAEAIAREMHMYYAAQAHNESNTPIPHWADLTENDQQGWIAVANTALPIIGKHALEDVRALSRPQGFRRVHLVEKGPICSRSGYRWRHPWRLGNVSLRLPAIPWT